MITYNYTTQRLQRLPKRTISIFKELENNISYTFSGKTSISLLLQAFASKGKLRDRGEQILVSHWIGAWVYMIMHRYCFPTTEMNARVRGLFVYHQWGFPQHMEPIMSFAKKNNLFVIEDCAHAFQSYYKGKRCGTFGDASIFSLAKFFPTVVGGAVYTHSKTLKADVKHSLVHDVPSLSKYAFRTRLAYDRNPSRNNLLELVRCYAIYDELRKCPSYALRSAQNDITNGALEKRKAHYEFFRGEFATSAYSRKVYCDDIIPWVFPIFVSNTAASSIVKRLRNAKIEAGVNHFDINRNMLRPNYRICVTVPCHQGMDIGDIKKIITTVNKCI